MLRSVHPSRPTARLERLQRLEQPRSLSALGVDGVLECSDLVVLSPQCKAQETVAAERHTSASETRRTQTHANARERTQPQTRWMGEEAVRAGARGPHAVGSLTLAPLTPAPVLRLCAAPAAHLASDDVRHAMQRALHRADSLTTATTLLRRRSASLRLLRPRLRLRDASLRRRHPRLRRCSSRL